MSTVLGSLRRILLAPSLSEVGFAARGFPGRLPAARLEAIPQSVVCGFEWGVDSADLDELRRRLDMVVPELRGFAYEGATMAAVIRDAMGMWRGSWTRDLLTGPGRPHIFMNYIGIGFAMARLPRPLWAKVVPDLRGVPYHPIMSWLAVDGYGFDLAYFDPARWVDRQEVPAPYPWDDAPDYFLRAVDQGIGRALWFIHAADASAVAAAVSLFSDHRQPDLWSGVGLAATVAGGCTAAELTELRRLAGSCGAELALGAVFAAKARSHAGCIPAHTAVATVALADSSVEAAVTLADATADVPGTLPAAEPPYEIWRRRIRGHFGAVPLRLSGDTGVTPVLRP